MSKRPMASKSQNQPSGQGLIQPLLLPFMTRPNCDPTRRVMLVLNTPDLPATKISQTRLSKACSTAFGPASTFKEVEAWSDHIWAARFEVPRCANKAKGILVDIDGVRVMAEHLYPRPPSVFICDFTDIDVSENEVAVRIAETFATYEEKPQLRLQASPKLYKGKQLWISLPRPMKLFRFYVPMLRIRSEDVFMACFRPVNATAPCALCDFKHGLNCCEQSRIIELQS